jgi:hypothetical protein
MKTHSLAVISLFILTAVARSADFPKSDIPPVTAEQAARRKARVAERRKGVDITCHRGSSEYVSLSKMPS